ncbi:serine/threonine-protein kinase [Winogradskya consettensis]|uniref:serine/threonine-protein kinase n=1 Tax=Winogradskya consettensis TaxID=113560 RepID=UPI001BB31693|nr:serine/threonine-protein kinase [Actinoplanes consettensis]
MQELAGRYRVGNAVGRGGSAVVHRGFDRTLKRHVAVKLFFPYGPGDNAADAVLLEARTAAGLNHPNIARVYDYGEVVDGADRTPFLIMEFVAGETLADRLKGTGPLPWQRAAEIGADVAAALAAAHEQNLVHRDVKPRNVMLSPDGTKVLDFGIAAAAGKNAVDTQGRLWGTPATLAPEQLRGEATYPAADVYALGLLLFECLTAERAWPGNSIVEILTARHHNPSPRLPRIPGIPRDLIRLYEACTADDPARRPTAAAAADILRRSSESLTAFIPAMGTTRSRRRGVVMAALGVVTVALTVVGMQLANGAATPGGHPADAAVGETPPAATTPAVPGSSTRPVIAPEPTAVVPVESTVPSRPRSSSKPAPSVSASRSASPSASPSGSPTPSTPTESPDTSPTPTEPVDPTTDPDPSSTPVETPPPTPTGEAQGLV